MFSLHIIVLTLCLYATIALSVFPSNLRTELQTCEANNNGLNISKIFKPHTNYELQYERDCLFYVLLNRTTTSNEVNVLRFPPSPSDARRLKVFITQIEISTLADVVCLHEAPKYRLLHKQNIYFQNAGNLERVSGIVVIEYRWKDNRFVWDQSKWKNQTELLMMTSNVWTPRYTTDVLVDLWSSDLLFVHPGLEYPDVEVKADHKGELRYREPHSTNFDCEIDYSRYPRDNHQCCRQFENHQFGEYEVVVDPMADMRSTRSISGDKIHKRWGVTSSRIRLTPSFETLETTLKSNIEFCFTLSRTTGMLKVELVVPVSLCTIVVLLAPFFGSMKTQSFVKLFAILLQLLCLDMLSRLVPRVAIGGATPNIYRFYEFSLMITMFSLVCSVLLNAAGKMPRTTPPSHTIYLSAHAINSRMCCSSEDVDAAREQRPHNYEPQHNETSTGDNNTQPKANYAPDWMCVYTAVNSAISLLLWPIYSFGILILMVF